MQTSVTPTKTLKHSSLGKTSFYLALIGDFFLLFAGIVALIAKSNGNEPQLGFFGAMFWIFIIPSTIMAIMDLNKQGQKKTLPKLALIFGIGMIGIILIVALLAMLVFFAVSK